MNEDIAKIFEELATLLELTGANGFRVNAHSKVARVVEGLTSDLGELARTDDAIKSLEAIDGIGKSSAQKIVEFAAQGTVTELEKLRASVPDGLREVMKVPGLGPKTVRRLWQEAEIESIEDLEAAIDDGRLEALPRMGRKTIDNIRESIDFMKTAGDRRRLGTAMPIAERLVAAMQAIPGVRKVAYAGSLRRGQETIGDLDLLVTTTDPTAASEAFRTQSGVTKILVAGETKSSVRLEDGIQVDLRVVPEEVWGAALMYFTGSKDHNVALRERAIGRGLRLNEYGLFPDDGEDGPPQQRGVTAIASATETEIYEALDLPWIPPELRVDVGHNARRVGVDVGLGGRDRVDPAHDVHVELDRAALERDGARSDAADVAVREPGRLAAEDAAHRHVAVRHARGVVDVVAKVLALDDDDGAAEDGAAARGDGLDERVAVVEPGVHQVERVGEHAREHHHRLALVLATRHEALDLVDRDACDLRAEAAADGHPDGGLRAVLHAAENDASIVPYRLFYRTHHAYARMFFLKCLGVH